MPLITSTINCDITLPDATEFPPGAELVFLLSGPDVSLGVVQSQIRTPDANTVLQTLASSLIASTAATRTDVVRATAAQTAAWPIGEYRWDVLFRDANGVEVRTPTLWVRVVERVTNV
jgi:hypothetical protein